jgi:UDP-2-acetamido-3-amino-2,3-dideoxy-glucuronate N-acetyltransferase
MIVMGKSKKLNINYSLNLQSSFLIKFLDKLYIESNNLIGNSMGTNCTIVCRNVIGRSAIVGGGVTVNGDVPDFALVIGTPAKIVGLVSEAGKKLDFDDEDYANCEKSNK